MNSRCATANRPSTRTHSHGPRRTHVERASIQTPLNTNSSATGPKAKAAIASGRVPVSGGATASPNANNRGRTANGAKTWTECGQAEYAIQLDVGQLWHGPYHDVVATFKVAERDGVVYADLHGLAAALNALPGGHAVVTKHAAPPR